MSVGLKGNADGSGAIQVGGTDAVTLSTALDTTLAGSLNAPNTFAFKNRIINGAMVIDQRNAGASVTPLDGTYLVDRWRGRASQSSKYTAQQNAASVTPPVGYANYLGITSSSAYSIGAGDFFAIEQLIEGLNTADLAWGTASAATVTLSFWVRSSLTGTFGGALENSSFTASYPFSYTISAANTWQQKTVTIAGNTSGVWLTTNGIGIRVTFGLGVGSTYSGTAGAWAASGLLSATGATSVVGTNGATFYVTGVQLERGRLATSFDFRDYGRELAMCQRYCWQDPNGVSGSGYVVTGGLSSILYAALPVTMRVAPSFTNITNGAIDSSTSSLAVTGCTLNGSTTNYIRLNPTTATSLGAAGIGAVLRTQVVRLDSEL
jgi:hypothetical protein